MLLNLDSSLLMATGASFLVGLLGYIIARMWIKPIVSYQLTKRKLGRELNRFLERIEADEQSSQSDRDPRARNLLKQARKYAMILETCYTNELPAWYRLFLASRQRSPEKVLAELAPLSKIKDNRQIAARVDNVRKTMGFS